MRLIAFDLIVLSVPADPAMGSTSTMVFWIPHTLLPVTTRATGTSIRRLSKSENIDAGYWERSAGD